MLSLSKCWRWVSLRDVVPRPTSNGCGAGSKDEGMMFIVPSARLTIQDFTGSGGSESCGARQCSPHSFLASCSHHHRPARSGSPAAMARVQGAQPIDG